MKHEQNAAGAASYQKVAAEEEHAGNLAGARRLYAKAARLYFAGLENGRSGPEAGFWKQEAELCLAKAEALGKGKSGLDSRVQDTGDEAIPGESGIQEYASTFRVEPRLRLRDVVGLDSAKQVAEELIEFVRASADADVLKRHPAFRPPTGALLIGAPGTGKSYFAESLGGEIVAQGGTFFRASAAQLKSKWYGESLRIIRALFQAAAASAPSIVFIDEIDSVAMSRSELDSDADRQLVTQFLVEIGGVPAQRGAPVFVIGATNVETKHLDAALFRPGRIERVIEIPAPDRLGRELLFRALLANEPLQNNFDCDRLASLTEGWTPAGIELLCRTAVGRLVRREFAEGAHLSMATGDVAALIDSFGESAPIRPNL